MLNYKSFVNNRLFESIGNNKNWINNVLSDKSIIRTKNTKEKLEGYLDKIYSFSEDNQIIDKKELTKIKNDFDKIMSTYYSLIGTTEEKSEILEEIAKSKGYSLYKAAYSTPGEVVLKVIANLHTYGLIDSKRGINKINDIKNQMSVEEINFIEKYYPNLDKWSSLYDKIEEISIILNPTKEQRETKKLQEIKGKVDPKIKNAIDEIAENFRIVIEEQQNAYYLRSVENLQKYFLNGRFEKTLVHKDDYRYVRELLSVLYFILDKPKLPEYILVSDYEEKILKQAYDDSIRIISKFQFKMYDKLGGFMQELGKDFTTNVQGKTHKNNDIYFKIEGGGNFAIRNQIVYKVSNRGTTFYTYPTNFLFANLPNGERVKDPSEYTVKKAFNDYYKGINESVKYTDEINEFMTMLDLFLKSKENRKWIVTDDVKIYVRKSKRYQNKQMYDCLDLASIEIGDTGKGLFTELFETILDKYKNKNIFVESILEKRFYNFIKKYGFEPHGNSEDSLIKIVE
jgi:hypothetical protein